MNLLELNMSARMLPRVRRLDYPEEFPLSLAPRYEIGGVWYIATGGSWDAIQFYPYLTDGIPDDDGHKTNVVVYKCLNCKGIFAAWDVEGMLHKCNGVEETNDAQI